MACPVVTPMQQVPGAFINTPTLARSDPVRKRLFQTGTAPFAGPAGPGTHQAQEGDELSIVSRAARRINSVLSQDEIYPDLDSCCRTGVSSNYDVQLAGSGSAPFFEHTKFLIPDDVLNQFNGAQVSTKMGLFTEINHAWIFVDNSLFIWDYTQAKPELVGYEECRSNITAVALVRPKKGVFVETIKYLLVIATSSEIVLLGVAVEKKGSRSSKITLYQTKMLVHAPKDSFNKIAASAAGRIFLGGQHDNHLHELYYYQEEKWFSSRCGTMDHSTRSFVGAQLSKYIGKASDEYLVDMVIDDSRNLVYTLSNRSTIRTYHMDGPDKLAKVIEKTKEDCLRDVTHMSDTSPLLNNRARIVALSPVCAAEASKLHLMALTNTGCRLFLSATSSASYMMNASSGQTPQSMQVQYIKFPPPASGSRRQRERRLSASDPTEDRLELGSRMLEPMRSGIRFAPGYFFGVVGKDALTDRLFLAAPDAGRIKKAGQTTALKYFEHASWIELAPGSRVLAVGATGQSFAAAKQPLGFGNELAVQFDQPPCEFAVLTNNGVQLLRRRRMVDLFAAAMRSAVGDEGIDKAVRNFGRHCGKAEIIAAALAVACGQGDQLDAATPRALDEETALRAKKVFLNYGGRPSVQEAYGVQTTTEHVDLSFRFQALTLYLGRIVRRIWKANVATFANNKSTGGLTIASTVAKERLGQVQGNLGRLKHFLDVNKGVIQGLSGPADLQRVSTRQDEVALQAEHQALHGLQKLMNSIAEGISFVEMLFEERVIDIFMQLDAESQGSFKQLTYEALFASAAGQKLAKSTVKAIVNRNIANGSNVDTVADALRRRCGSFCSTGDVIVFKAQEALSKAKTLLISPATLRAQLAESLWLFEKVAQDLQHEHLVDAVLQYIDLQYYAGAIRLCLAVAKESDRGNQALAWMNDGRPDKDARAEQFRKRKRCYGLIHDVLSGLDELLMKEPEMVDERSSLAATKRNEAYAVVNDSDDEVFHFDLYDWYIQHGWTDRILAMESPHVVTFLTRLAATEPQHAHLLCRFCTRRRMFFQAAKVQRDLATSDFELGLKERITLLSQAKGNASVVTVGVERQQQQQLKHDVTELLEVAHIQDDLLQKLLADERIPDERKAELKQALDGPIQDLTLLFNNYADQAGYYDLCLIMFHAADYHNARVILDTWQQLLQLIHEQVEQRHDEWAAMRQQVGRQALRATADMAAPPLPYEMVLAKMEELAHRTSMNSLIFPMETLLPLLCAYAVSNRQDASVGADACWPVLIWLKLGVGHALVLRVLEKMLDAHEAPFQGRRRRSICDWIGAVADGWVRLAERGVANGEGVTKGGSHGDRQFAQWLGELMGVCVEVLDGIVNGAGHDEDAEVEDAVRIRVRLRALKQTLDGLVGQMDRASLLRSGP